MSTLGSRCLKAREKAGITQHETAYRLRSWLPARRSPDGSIISRLERGEIAKPEPYLIAALAKVYGVKPVELGPRDGGRNRSASDRPHRHAGRP